MNERDQMVRDSIQRRISEMKNKKFSKEVDYFIKALRVGNGIKPVKIRTAQGYLDVLIQLHKLTPDKCLMDLTKEDLILEREIHIFQDVDESV